MKINNTKVYDVTYIKDIYSCLLSPFKRRACQELANKGYYFFVNNSHSMDTQRRWEHYDLVKVMRSKKVKPSVLWAVRAL